MLNPQVTMALLRNLILLLIFAIHPLFAAGNWNGISITGWNNKAVTSWNGTGVSASGGGGGMTISGISQDNTATSGATVSTGTLTILNNDIIVVFYANEDNGTAGNLTIANSGTALSWNLIAQTSTSSNCKVSAWWAKSAGNENRTVTVTESISGGSKAIWARVHTGAHQTDPCPAAKVFSGVNATDVSQSITPSATGSALWMICGDWGATDSFSAISNCTLENKVHGEGAYTATLIRPTTQPRSSGSAFTIGETDTSGQIAWIALEVRLP